MTKGNSNPSGLNPMQGRNSITGEPLNKHQLDEI